MAYWYAPVLAGWHGLSPAKALFFSFVACLRNWRAFPRLLAGDPGRRDAGAGTPAGRSRGLLPAARRY
jgi:hypothetical protein